MDNKLILHFVVNVGKVAAARIRFHDLVFQTKGLKS